MALSKVGKNQVDEATNFTVQDGTIKLDGNYPVGTGNVALGDAALDDASLSGGYNTAIGNNALTSNTTASFNTAVGYQAGYSNTTGVNAAIGAFSLYSNTTGTLNVAISPYSAMYSNTTGGSNTAIGHQSLSSNTTASNNTAVGYQAGYSNTTGTWLTAFGTQAGYSQTTPNFNAAFGGQALYSNTTGENNVAIGQTALYSNTTAIDNTAVGYQAGYSNTTGSYNTYLGDHAGYAATNTRNTFVGHASGESMTTGERNTILGRFSGNQGGLDIRTSSNNIVLADGDGTPYLRINGVSVVRNEYRNSSGSQLGALTFGASYDEASTNDALLKNYAGGDFHIVAGSIGVYLTNGANSWTANSDERLKDIIEPITNAANKVSQLRTVIGKYKTDEEGKRRAFLIAQDVQEVLPEAVNIKNDEDATLGVAYTDIIPLLTAAIKEQQATITALTARIEALEAN